MTLFLVWFPLPCATPGRLLRSFFEELQYRNVIRVAIAYAVVGWLVAQVADLVVDAFNLPDKFMQTVIILLVLGFPVAVFLAWAFELTPEGVKKAEDLPADMPKDPRSGRRLNAVIMTTLVVAVAWLGWDKLQGPDAESVVTDKSIAVLPFDDFSPGGDHAWFADGLAEEVLNSLARTADLQVASRTSSFKYRGSELDIPAIAIELGVAHILEGSVRRAGDQLRVTAQLIRAADDKHLWSETFDGSIENSIAIQDEIAVEIARAMQTAMDPEELARMVSAGTRSVEAWELYLRGLAAVNQAFENINTALMFDAAELFDAAVASDPDFVDAHMNLMSLWWLQLDSTTTAYGYDGPPYAERRARFDAAVDASLRLARTELERLEVEYRKALVSVQIHEQVRIVERMTVLAPNDYDYWRYLMELYQLTGQMEKAYDAAMTSWSLPRDPDEYRTNVLFHMRRLNMDKAIQLVEEMLTTAEEAPLRPIFYYQAHRVFLDAGELEKAAGVIDHYLLRSEDEPGKAMVLIRQACAEGRVADADAVYDALQADAGSRWLILMTLGLHDEALESLRPLDTPEKLFMLAGHLDYRTFEARDYPLLWRTLRAQGIDRPPARPQTFQCERPKDQIRRSSEAAVS